MPTTPPRPDAASIASLLSDLAFGFAILNDRRRPGAYRNGARVIKKLGPDLPRALASGELLATKGIGKSIVHLVQTALEGREIEVFARLGEQLPLGLLAARKVRGLGPGRVRTLWQTLGCETLGEIEYACIENRLVDLPGFSVATQTAVLAAIMELRDRAGKLRVDQGLAIAAQATSLSQLLGGATADPAPAMGHVLVVGGLALAVMSGLHVRATELLIRSYELFPTGALPDARDLGLWGVGRIARAFKLAFMLAAPFAIASLIYYLTLGVINRAMPQLMVAFVGAPVITLGGLFLLFAGAPLMLSVWTEALNGFLSDPTGVK